MGTFIENGGTVVQPVKGNATTPTGDQTEYTAQDANSVRSALLDLRAKVLTPVKKSDIEGQWRQELDAAAQELAQAKADLAVAKAQLEQDAQRLAGIDSDLLGVQTLAGSKTAVIYSQTPPNDPHGNYSLREGDIWFDTGSDVQTAADGTTQGRVRYAPYRRVGSSWVQAESQTLLVAGEIAAGAINAQALNVTDINAAGTLKVRAVNVTGTLTATQINTQGLAVDAAYVTGTLDAAKVNALDLNVSAAKIVGTLDASKVTAQDYKTANYEFTGSGASEVATKGAKMQVVTGGTDGTLLVAPGGLRVGSMVIGTWAQGFIKIATDGVAFLYGDNVSWPANHTNWVTVNGNDCLEVAVKAAGTGFPQLTGKRALHSLVCYDRNGFLVNTTTSQSSPGLILTPARIAYDAGSSEWRIALLATDGNVSLWSLRDANLRNMLWSFDVSLASLLAVGNTP